MTDQRRRAPSAPRNREPILEVLRGALPASGLVLEIASGTGEHVAHFARFLPGLTFQPSDPDPNARASVAAWIAAEGLSNIRPPMELDASRPPWPVAKADAVVCVNMIHISPWESTLGLMSGAAAILPSGGPLVLYGPYRRAGLETAASNEAFDADLKRRNPAWGLRDLDDVSAVASAAGFSGPNVFEMPANNLCVVFRRF